MAAEVVVVLVTASLCLVADSRMLQPASTSNGANPSLPFRIPRSSIKSIKILINETVCIETKTTQPHHYHG